MYIITWVNMGQEFQVITKDVAAIASLLNKNELYFTVTSSKGNLSPSHFNWIYELLPYWVTSLAYKKAANS